MSPFGSGQDDIARRRDLVGALVVGHRVGMDDIVALGYLHIAAGGDDAELLVIGQFVRLQQDRLLRGRCFSGGLLSGAAILFSLGGQRGHQDGIKARA